MMTSKVMRRLVGVIGVVIFVGFILIVSYLFQKNFGDITKDPQRLREIVVGYGIWGYVVFSLINIFQILFAPIPGNIVTISSGILFGLVRGIIVTWFSVVIGASIAMAGARTFGRRILYYLLDERAAQFEAGITKKGLTFIIFLSIFPNPVGDGLFYLAGITDVPLRILVPIIALGRLPGIIVSVLIGDQILKAGIKGWLIGGVGMLVAIVLYLIFIKRIEDLFARLIRLA